VLSAALYMYTMASCQLDVAELYTWTLCPSFATVSVSWGVYIVPPSPEALNTKLYVLADPSTGIPASAPDTVLIAIPAGKDPLYSA
jgi:hypothetical protein